VHRDYSFLPWKHSIKSLNVCAFAGRRFAPSVTERVILTGVHCLPLLDGNLNFGMHITASPAQIELESFFYYIKYRPPTSCLPQKRERSERRRNENHKAKKSEPRRRRNGWK
jgi:hypothetical protein